MMCGEGAPANDKLRRVSLRHALVSKASLSSQEVSRIYSENGPNTTKRLRMVRAPIETVYGL